MKQGHIGVWRDAAQQAQLSVDYTETAAERMRGLLGSECLPQGCAMWIAPCNSVHCWFMAYVIDVLYLNKRGGIVKTVEGLKPWRISACFGAASVIELAQGEVARLGLQVGDEVRWCD